MRLNDSDSLTSVCFSLSVRQPLIDASLEEPKSRRVGSVGLSWQECSRDDSDLETRVSAVSTLV